MRKNEGITLIALIITIIVMLILVAVSVNILIKSNLIGTAERAGDKYKTATEEEANGGTIEINGKKYNSIEDYMEEINPTIVEPENIDDWIYVVEEDGTITLNGYKGQDKEVVIPNYINGLPVKKLGRTHHAYCGPDSKGTFWDPSICTNNRLWGYYYIQNDITSVTISEGIEMIKGYAFYASQGLTKITIPSSVTSIGYSAFSNCTSLTEITIPSSVTSIESNTFSNCTSLTEITIPNGVTSIGNSAFGGCTSLTDIVIPGNVTTMEGHVFANIPLITVHVPWKEGEKPDGWDENWAETRSDYTITIDYAK